LLIESYFLIPWYLSTGCFLANEVENLILTDNRVVITGIGIVSSIGADQKHVLTSLKYGRSGTRFAADFHDRGLRSHVCGEVGPYIEGKLKAKVRRFMGEGVAANHLSMTQAIKDSGLPETDISHPRTGLIMGSGGTSAKALVSAADTLRQRGIKRVSPFTVLHSMCSTHSANLAQAFGIQGVNHSVSAACASSLIAIGNAYEKIRAGHQDIMFAGGGEEVHWVMALIFDAMQALSTDFNDTPQVASRPFDTARDGFVISGGGGVVVLERLDKALDRGAKIYGEITGFGETGGKDMVKPDVSAMVRCMKMALQQAGHSIEYINAHATGTPIGDVAEVCAFRETFGSAVCPPISSTKSMTGHALGAAGVHELIYSLLMMKYGFIAPSTNISDLDPEADGLPIIMNTRENVAIDAFMTNNFGFGGANAALVVKRHML